LAWTFFKLFLGHWNWLRNCGNFWEGWGKKVCGGKDSWMVWNLTFQKGGNYWLNFLRNLTENPWLWEGYSKRDWITRLGLNLGEEWGLAKYWTFGGLLVSTGYWPFQSAEGNLGHFWVGPKTKFF